MSGYISVGVIGCDTMAGNVGDLSPKRKALDSRPYVMFLRNE